MFNSINDTSSGVFEEVDSKFVVLFPDVFHNVDMARIRGDLEIQNQWKSKPLLTHCMWGKKKKKDK